MKQANLKDVLNIIPLGNVTSINRGASDLIDDSYNSLLATVINT